MWELTGLVLIGCMIAVFLAASRGRPRTSSPWDTGSQKALRAEQKIKLLGRYREPEQRLLGACFGNHEQMERLIAYEMARRPMTNRNGAIEAALYSLEQDRR